MTDAPPPSSWYEHYLRGEPIDLKGRAGLLIDGTLVEDRWNLHRFFNAPIKHPRNPVVVADKPWEAGGVAAPSVLWDAEAGLFRMWYVIHASLWYPSGAWKGDRPVSDWQPKVVAYAESADGVNWRKPEVRSYAGYDATNVVFLGEHKSVPSHRASFNHSTTGQSGKFLMSYADYPPSHGRSMHLAYSDDGVNWRRDPANPVLAPVRDTRHNLIYDQSNERWLCYTRPVVLAASQEHWMQLTGTRRNMQRRLAVAVGKTPQSLGPIHMLRWPDEGEPPDYDDFMVNRVGSHYVGFITGMYNPPQYNAEIYLGFSSDGLHWNRLPDNPTLIPRGRDGDFDAGLTCSVQNLVTRDDVHYLYYHGGAKAWKVPDTEYHIGLAKIRRHRFVAQMANDDGGYLLTRLVRVTDPHLRVNMTLPTTVGARAEISSEVLAPDERGVAHTVPGYTFDECVTTATDGLDVPIRWREHPDLSRFVGDGVLIRFFLRNVGLYTFQFTPE